ncbi:MAG TPA: hypothetical protein VLG67_00345 [Candidatus Saccharimonadales bacterium]|nr:hypothetical protein [Candidatus Saccharimonadales bacterium]
MFEIIPSPGTEDKTFEEIEKKLHAVKGLARTIHIDIIDGKFANNKTFSDPTPFAKFAKSQSGGLARDEKGGTSFIFEVHLMVHEPIKYLKSFAQAGFSRFIGQIEHMSDQAEFVAEAQLLGDAGLAVDLQTGIDAIKVPLSDLDAILVMGVQAGFSGQTFSEDALVKIKDLVDQTDVPIEVDGGINERTIQLVHNLGATRFVATNFLFGQKKSPKEQFKLLEKVLLNER